MIRNILSILTAFAIIFSTAFSSHAHSQIRSKSLLENNVLSTSDGRVELKDPEAIQFRRDIN